MWRTERTHTDGSPESLSLTCRNVQPVRHGVRVLKLEGFLPHSKGLGSERVARIEESRPDTLVSIHSSLTYGHPTNAQRAESAVSGATVFRRADLRCPNDDGGLDGAGWSSATSMSSGSSRYGNSSRSSDREVAMLERKIHRLLRDNPATRPSRSSTASGGPSRRSSSPRSATSVVSAPPKRSVPGRD
jgi:hypothetical protein